MRLLLDGELDTRLDQLRTQIRRAKARELADPQGLATQVPLLETDLGRLTVEADEATTEFTFQAISRTALEDLKRNHPPSEEQWLRYKESVNDLPVLVALQQNPPEFDWLTMAPALLAACAVDPKMTRDEAQVLWDELSDAEAAQLFNAAWGVNAQAATRPFSGTDTAMTPSFGPSSTTPESEASPSLSLAEGS